MEQKGRQKLQAETKREEDSRESKNHFVENNKKMAQQGRLISQKFLSKPVASKAHVQKHLRYPAGYFFFYCALTVN